MNANCKLMLQWPQISSKKDNRTLSPLKRWGKVQLPKEKRHNNKLKIMCSCKSRWHQSARLLELFLYDKSFFWRKPRKESGAGIIANKLLSIFCSLHIPNVTSPHILLTTMDAQLPTKPLINLVTINLRPWGWTSQPWKRHLGPAREGLLTRKLICYLWIRDWFRECLGKLDSRSCFPITQTTSIRGGWF